MLISSICLNAMLPSWVPFNIFETMDTVIQLAPIGYVKNSRTEVKDDFWGLVRSEIRLNDTIPDEALAGIETFSHIEIVYFFHRVPEIDIVRSARHPRGNKAWPRVGIFAQRAKDRPNRIGLCMARVVSRTPGVLLVDGLDAIDDTPVLDIKPVMKEFLPQGPVTQPAWCSELMEKYWYPTCRN